MAISQTNRPVFFFGILLFELSSLGSAEALSYRILRFGGPDSGRRGPTRAGERAARRHAGPTSHRAPLGLAGSGAPPSLGPRVVLLQEYEFCAFSSEQKAGLPWKIRATARGVIIRPPADLSAAARQLPGSPEPPYASGLHRFGGSSQPAAGSAELSGPGTTKGLRQAGAAMWGPRRPPENGRAQANGGTSPGKPRCAPAPRPPPARPPAAARRPPGGGRPPARPPPSRRATSLWLQPNVSPGGGGRGSGGRERPRLRLTHGGSSSCRRSPAPSSAPAQR